MERRSGKIHRMLKLCKTIDDSAITAEYKDGVLTLTLPRAEKEDSRKIDVSINWVTYSSIQKRPHMWSFLCHRGIWLLPSLALLFQII